MLADQSNRQSEESVAVPRLATAQGSGQLAYPPIPLNSGNYEITWGDSITYNGTVQIPSSTPLPMAKDDESETEKFDSSLYCSTVGSLLYLSNNTRPPDLTFAVRKVSLQGKEFVSIIFISIKYIIFLVDAYSNWLVVCEVKSTSAESVVAKLSSYICTFGLLKEIESHNGPRFDSAEFLDFSTANNILVSNSPPYHLESNGNAERVVHTIEDALMKGIMDTRNAEKLYSSTKILFDFLLHHRNTPTTVKGKIPAKLIFNYKPQTLLSACKPQRQAIRKLVKLEPEAKS